MSLHPIKDFILRERGQNPHKRDHQFNWPKTLRKAGYIGVQPPDDVDEDAMCDWLDEHMPDRFVWTGYFEWFWFEDEKDAVHFKLRWG